MNRVARMIMQAKMTERGDRMNDREQSGRDYERDRRDYTNRGRKDYADDEIDEYEDHRRGSRDRRTRGDRGESMRLSKFDIMRWCRMLKNADGTTGKHFSIEDVEQAARQLSIHFDEFSEAELCMTMNMLYSDLCEVNRPYVSPDREAHYYAKLAQAWLEDDDGPGPSEKLALYFYCISDDE